MFFTELVYSTLPCPCEEVFVNGHSGGEIDALAALRTEYEDRGRGAEACPSIACLPPTSGTCSAGRCASE